MVRELSEKEKKKALKETHHKKINYALAKAIIKDFEVYQLVRDFFSEFLNLKYQFTHEELAKELDKLYIDDSLKKRILAFLEKLTYVEFYSRKELNQVELKGIINEFKTIVNDLIIVEETKEGFLNKILRNISGVFSKKPKIEKAEKIEQLKEEMKRDVLPKEADHKIYYEHKSLDGAEAIKSNAQIEEEKRKEKNKLQDESVIAESTELLPIDKLIKNINIELSKSNISDAKRMYYELLQFYNSLNYKDQQKYYVNINQIYAKLKSEL